MHATVRVDPVPVHMLDLLRSLEAAYLAAPAADLEEMARWIEEEALEVADLFRQSVTLHDILRLADDDQDATHDAIQSVDPET